MRNVYYKQLTFFMFVLYISGGGKFMKDAVKHSGLTGWFRHKLGGFEFLWAGSLMDILYRCDVSDTVGALPPELCSIVNKSERGKATKKFSEILSAFIRKNIIEIRNSSESKRYDLAEISNLFGTDCYVQTAGVDVMGYSKWEGGYAIVAKLVFPKLNAEYALKMFFEQDEIPYDLHGKHYEIPVALACHRAEPKQNNICYLASFADSGFMLSKWMGEKDYVSPKKNKNPIFITSMDEAEARNFRSGKRIDFGETYKTPYGRADYDVRKIYRKITNGPKETWQNAVYELIKEEKNYVQRQKIKEAVRVVNEMQKYSRSR